MAERRLRKKRALEGKNIGYAVFALAAVILTFIFLIEATRYSALAAALSSGDSLQ